MEVLNQSHTATPEGDTLAVTAGVKAIVFAGGQGSRLVPLVTDEIPKSLLPVATRPALFYSLQSLLRAHIRDITVVTSPSSTAPVTAYLTEVFRDDVLIKPLNPSDIRVHESALGDDTADALRAFPTSSADYLLLSGDIVGDVGIHELIREHRAMDAVCTVSLHENKEETDTYSLMNDTGSRLLGLYYGTDLDGSTIRVRGPFLKQFPKICLRKDVSDIHAYVLSSCVVHEVLKIRPAISSVRYDLVPYLARRQLKLTRENGDEVVVAVHMAEGFVERVNSVDALLATNVSVARGVLNPPAATASKEKGKKKQSMPKLAKKGDKTNIGTGCVVGSGVEAGDRTSVKKSVVGNGVILGNQVKLNGCIVGNDVRILDQCNLNSTFVSLGATIQGGCKLKDCTIAPGVVVPENTDATGKAFSSLAGVEDDDDIDLGDDITFE